MSNLHVGGRLKEVITYESSDRIGSNFASSAYGNYRELPHVSNILLMRKVYFDKKKVLPIEKFLSLVRTFLE